MTTKVRKPPTMYKGVVAARSGDKTVRVTIEYRVKHPKYGKVIKRRTTARVHDEANEARVGDLVQICKCRRYSKTKSWRLVKVLTAMRAV